jgi:hypothetical protein
VVYCNGLENRRAARLREFESLPVRFYMIHEFRTPLSVKTPHGDGQAILLIDYGINVNTVWVVRLDGGLVKHYYSEDIRIYDNPMNGKGWDVE